MTDAATEATTPDSKDRDTKIRKAYANAIKRLRDTHLEEFRALQAEEAAALGVDWTPKPTKEEKAEAQLAELLAANPTLKERLTNEVKAQLGAE